MKYTWMILVMGLLCGASAATAAEVKLVLHIPQITPQGLQGHANTVSVWVEDKRANPVFGKDLEGANVTTNQDVAIVVKNALITSLRAAGFRIEPMRTRNSTDMLVHIRSLTYSADKNVLTSTVHLSSKVSVTVDHAGERAMQKDITTSGEYTVAWRPSNRKITELVNETLRDTIRAVLEDSDISSALKDSSKAAEAD